MNNLVGLVTGAASGLGKATALKLLQCGMRVITLDKNFSEDNEENYAAFATVEKSTLSVDNVKENCLIFKGDIQSENDVKNSINAGLKKWKKLNVVVNCAGVASSMLIYSRSTKNPIELQPFKDCMDINVSGTFNVIRLAAQAIAKSEFENDFEDKAIINVTGIDFHKGTIRNSVNAAVSGAITSMTLPISRDLSSLGIRVVTISSGYFDTPMLGHHSDILKTFLGRCNVFPHRVGEPNEFALCVKSVIENKMLNGEIIQLDAGCMVPSFDFN